MPPLYSFVAWSNTGKTTYIEKLIAELTRRGLRVGAIKHDAHEFEVDKPGKDSWRFGQAGAEVVAVSSQTKAAVMEYRALDFHAVLSRIRDVDVILCEGWHAEAGCRVVLYRQATGLEPKIPPRECAAVISDAPLDTGGVPVFPLDDPAPFADFIQASL